MLGSITPLGERSRGRRWGVTVTAFALAAVAAGAAAGALLGAAGGAAGAHAGMRAWLLAAAVAAAIAVDAAPGLHAPGPRRQVNEEWLHRYRGWVYGAGFGLQLGLGVTTIVSTAAVYATAAAAVLSGSAAAGAAVGAAFGAARAVTLLSARRVREPRALAALERRLQAWERPARSAALAAEAGLVVAAAALALSA
jgi:MFS family permease